MDRSWACCSPSLVIVARIVFGPEIGVLLDLDDPRQGLYGLLRNVLPFILLGISALLLLTETTRLDWPRFAQRWSGRRLGRDSRTAGIIGATGYFLLAGLYGWAVFELPARSPVNMPNPSLLLPSLAGLFGISISSTSMPPRQSSPISARNGVSRRPSR